MKVKVGNNIYDASEEPIMIILTDQDKENIFNMSPMCNKYAAAPDTMDEKSFDKWMNADEI
jgi:hypothetical protein